MADINLELSGLKGLSNGHSGDADMITPQPNLRIAEEPGQFVAGLFNPYLRKGYLAPATTTSVPITTDTTPASQLTSVEYDSSDGSVYWGDDTRTIYKGDSLTDTSLAEHYVLESYYVDDYPEKKYDELYDLQMYQINGERQLFYVGKGLNWAGTQKIKVARMAEPDGYMAASLAVNPSATTKPAVTSIKSVSDATAGTSLSTSFTVSATSNRALFAIALWASNTGEDGCTWNGTAMSRVRAHAFGPSAAIYSLTNPEAGTYNVQMNWDSSLGSDAVLLIVETNNTNQSFPVDVDSNRESVLTGGEDNIEIAFPALSTNQLNLVSWLANTNPSLSDPEPVVIDTVVTSILEEDDIDGEQWYYLLGEADVDIYGLMVGHGTREDWLLSRAVGGFTHELLGDYAFMRIADNGFAYIFADNKVHKIDGGITGGEYGSATKNVLLFPEYFRIQDARDYRSRLYIAINQNPVTNQTTSLNTFPGKCGIYVWNRISTQLSSADYIELPGVREIKKLYASPDGVLKLLVINSSGMTELRAFGYNDSGGVVFPVQKELGIGAYPQVPDGCVTAGDKTVWLANNGSLYCEKENSVTKIYQTDPVGETSTSYAENVSSGAVFYGSGTETADAGFRSNKQALSFSYDDGTVTHEKIYPFDLTTGDNSAQNPHQGDVYTGVNYLPIGSNVERLRIYNAPIPGTGSGVIATVKLYFNQSTTATMPDGITKTITKDEAKRGYVDFQINKPYIHAVQIEIEWATSEPLGDDTYLPSIATVLFTDTTSISGDNG